MSRNRRALGTIALLATLALPAPVAAAPPVERIIEREHRTEIVQVVTDDVCGDLNGGHGLRSGTFRLIETGHRHITVYDDRFHVVDVENGTYSYDFDDPLIPDVSGYRYTSPFALVVNKNDSVIVMENQIEFLPGHPDGIRIAFRYHLTWHNGEPVVERVFFSVTGCP